MKNLRPSDLEKLVFIHSNRNITPLLFHQKYFKNKSMRMAQKQLKFYAEKGYLKPFQTSKFFKMIYVLTDSAIKELTESYLLLAKNLRPAKISLRTQQHHERVTELRISFESNPDFDDVFFVTDFEFMQGINRETKWNYYRDSGVEKRKEFLKEWKPNPKDQKLRYPDGYFDAVVKGESKPFVLEYEHFPYSRDRIFSVVDHLEREYPDATKVLVCRDQKRIELLEMGIVGAITSTKRKFAFNTPWLISYFEKAISEPFFTAFRPIKTDKLTNDLSNKL